MHNTNVNRRMKSCFCSCVYSRHVPVHVCIVQHTHVCFACMHVCMYVHEDVCLHVCMYVFIYVCMYVCEDVCIYVCMYVSMYV